jgi:subtilisin family serine protease
VVKPNPVMMQNRRMTRQSRALAGAFGVLVLFLVGLAAPAGAAAPGAFIEHANGIAGHYIVTLREGSAAAQAKMLAGGAVTAVYGHAVNGFAVAMPAAAARALAHNPNVASVEQDVVVAAAATQTNPPWGVDRIDQRPGTLDKRFNYSATGAGVTAYVLDTGVRGSHVDFGGRVTTQFNAFTGTVEAPNDCQGHGTHVADTLAGATYGVAKGATLVAVKVLDCSGNGAASVVIAGLDWVAANHAAGEPAVANLSLQETQTSVMAALDSAVTNVIADGVATVVAAGNGGGFLGLTGGNACNVSPARVPSAITVSATDSKDTRSGPANYGTCVDIFAPGVSVVAASNASDTATATKSGTSMSAPHVAGIAAMYLQGGAAATPAQVASWITAAATTGVVKSAGTGSPNRLAFTGGL